MELLDRLRAACAAVAERAEHVHIEHDAIPAYAASLPCGAPELDPAGHLTSGSREARTAFWLTLDAINFGSGWFPTLHKRDGCSGYFTIATGVRDHGPWRADELAEIGPGEVASALGQDQDHELMALFACSLNDLGRRVAESFDGRFAAVADVPGAAALVDRLAGWSCFSDTSSYDELELPFLKRAQIAAADLAGSGLLGARDLDRLTMFADNLVPHVLRLDGVLRFDQPLVDRIERCELIEHGSPEEVEIRACAVHAVELIVAARDRAGTPSRACEVDQVLWHRGQGASYKSRPRHRARCTAY
jgi:hypothetical protein